MSRTTQQDPRPVRRRCPERKEREQGKTCHRCTSTKHCLRAYHIAQANELEQYLLAHPDQSVRGPQYPTAVTVTSTHRMATGHAGRVRGLAGSDRAAGPYLERMQQLADHLKNDPS